MDEVTTKLAGFGWQLSDGEDISFLPAGILGKAVRSDCDKHRHKFGLTGPRKDYFLYHATKLIRSIRDLPERLGEKHSSVELHRWSPAPNTWIGADAFKIGICGPFVLHAAADWPVSFEAVLKYLSPKRGRLTVGSRSEEININPSNGKLYPDWPSWSGIGCGLEAPWASGSELLLKFTPTNFPYKEFVESLQVDADILLLMELAGLSEEFQAATSPSQKAAFLFAALAYSTDLEESEPTPSWIPCGKHE
jgi:hypothetical protein